MEPMCELRSVTKTFRQGHIQVRALNDVTLPIYAGEMTLVEGPSGSGKTTLLHILGLLQRADTGEVWNRGQRLDQLPESRLACERRRNVVLIFQGANLLQSLSVYDNIAIALHGNQGNGRQAAVTDHLTRMGLADRSRHFPRQLSGGEKQRTAIARALACPGRLVLADEPTANLDWGSARTVVERLAELAHEDGRAVIMVTHDSRVEPYADRIVRIEDGRIIGDRRRNDMPTGLLQPTNDLQRNGVRSRRALSVIGWIGGVIIVGLAAALALVNQPKSGRKTPISTPTHKAPRVDMPNQVAAAPAVVEPATHVVKLQTERPGRITEVLKHAGDKIYKGEPLVKLDDTIPAANVAQRKAELQLAEAELDELAAWQRPEERSRLKAALEYAQVLVDRNARELERVDSLFDSGSASKTERDHAVEDDRMARASLDEARQAYDIAMAGPTPQAVAVAEARVAQAQAALLLAEKELSYYTIVSPLAGHVIYRHLEPGEVVDPESPQPILSIGNLDAIRLRAEVDEADIKRVHVGQKVIADAEAYADQIFHGEVVHLEPIMGRTSIRTERTTEQKDTKVREVLIALDPATTPRLPIDLQMTVRFLKSDSEKAP